MPSTKAKTAFKILVENGGSTGAAMIKAGYSPATAKNPSEKLLRSKGWQELLAQYNEEPVLDNVYAIALAKEDKRAVLTAAELIFRLNDRFPASKLKMMGAFEYRKRVEEKEDPAP